MNGLQVRDGFREIVSGWMLVDDFDDLTDRIERAAEWTKEHGPLLPDEEATIKFMIDSQIARGIARGDFDDLLAKAMTDTLIADLSCAGHVASPNDPKICGRCRS